MPATELSISEREDWLERRLEGIGSSDAAALLGLNPRKSALALWGEKVGAVDPESLEDKEYIEWGNILEEPIANRYAYVTGRRLIDHGRFAIRFSEQYPWMHCTSDREIVPIDERGPGSLSIKNAGAYKSKDWEDEAPLEHQVQLQHELVVHDWKWGSFAVLIGGNKFGWLDMPRNERFCAYLVEKEEEFVDRVRRGDPPPPDASDSTREVLLRLYPKDNNETVELDFPPEIAERRRALKKEEKRVEAELQEIDNQLKAAIGNATIGLFCDGTIFSWKWQQRAGYVVEPTEFRVLRELKGRRR